MKFADPTNPSLAELDAIMKYVGGDLDLGGTPITALPEGLSVGGSLYLHGTPITVIYRDDRGYELRRVRVGASGEWFVAGCRPFKCRADALAHWGDSESPSPRRGAAFCAAINNSPEGWE